jgi:hypothetical protein
MSCVERGTWLDEGRALDSCEDAESGRYPHAVEGGQRTLCGSCSSLVDERALLLEKRQPCPKCGSRIRVFEIELGGEVGLRSSLGLKARRGDRGRPFVEMFTGADLWLRAGQWMHKVRRIDRNADAYEETVTDPETGEVVHETVELLSEHRGHGSAKQR